MIFQKLLMTGCRDMDKKNIKNTSQICFSLICDPPRFFFKNRALSLLYPYGALTSCKKFEKNNEQSLRYLKTDHGRTNGQGRLLRTPSGKPGVQNDLCLKKIFGKEMQRMHNLCLVIHNYTYCA